MNDRLVFAHVMISHVLQSCAAIMVKAALSALVPIAASAKEGGKSGNSSSDLVMAARVLQVWFHT